MREAELRVIDCLRDQSYSVGELADAIDKSQSWTSEVVGDLENAHLVDRTDGVQLAPTYEASLLAELLERYALEKVLTGTKEDILVALLPEVVALRFELAPLLVDFEHVGEVHVDAFRVEGTPHLVGVFADVYLDRLREAVFCFEEIRRAQKRIRGDRSLDANIHVQVYQRVAAIWVFRGYTWLSVEKLNQ